jgi:hypothetical protein
VSVSQTSLNSLKGFIGVTGSALRKSTGQS